MVDERPIAFDLFCGLGGWAEGLLATGWRVIGFDVEHRSRLCQNPTGPRFNAVGFFHFHVDLMDHVDLSKH